MKQSEQLFTELLTKFEKSEITDENIQECIEMMESYAKEIALKAYVLGACDEGNEKYNPFNPEVRFNTWYAKLKQ